jgi:hypothetical protein
VAVGFSVEALAAVAQGYPGTALGFKLASWGVFIAGKIINQIGVSSQGGSTSNGGSPPPGPGLELVLPAVWLKDP